MNGSTNRSLRFLSVMLRRRSAVLAVLIGLISALVGIVDPGFLSTGVWTDILIRSSPAAIVACGLMLTMVTGEIDISMGSLMALLAAAFGLMVSRHHGDLSIWLGIPLTLFIGTLIGLMTGLMVTVGTVPSIVVTLGLLTAFRGLTSIVMDGRNIDGLPENLLQLTRTGIAGIPACLWAAATVILLTFVIIHHTALGRRLFAAGSSPSSALIAGLPVRRLKIFTFAWTGFLTALATVFDVPRLPKIEAGIGMEFELLVVTCVVVGGVSVAGGKGQLSGVLLAVVLMTMVRPVLTFLDIGESGERWTRAIQGSFILLAVVCDSLLQRKHLHKGCS
jgi:ribose transport system permease protein